MSYAEASTFYGGKEVRSIPIYTVGETARYLHIPKPTVRSWVVGRSYPTQEGQREFQPLINLADPEKRLLSFSNLIEVHILRALRTEHSFPMNEVRQALRFAAEHLGIPHLLLMELRVAGRELFLDRYGDLLSLNKAGQLAMRKILEAHLSRIGIDDEKKEPTHLYPFLTTETSDGPRTIIIDPRISFGRPTVAGKGVATSVIVQRINAGETVEALAYDYDMTDRQIEEAVIYDRAA